MSGSFRTIPATVGAIVFVAGGLGTLALAAWVWRVASGNSWLVGWADAALGEDTHGEGVERARPRRAGA